jgi:hypothetical protein
MFAYVALQYQVVHQVDNLGHGGLFPPFSPRWMRKLNRLAIAQQAPGKQ